MRDHLQTLEEPGLSQLDSAEITTGQQSVTLRVLATSDIHMQLQGFDYIGDQPGQNAGLAGLATLIHTARAEAAAQDMPSVLLDNGDLLQGTVLGERLAHQRVTPDHPVVACMRRLGYDAMGLGNHDLDHGLPYLNAVACHLGIPVISTNLGFRTRSAITRSTLLQRSLSTSAEGPKTLRIGIVSVLPEGTAHWNNYELRGHAEVLPARDSLLNEVAALCSKGADIVILLAHMGLEGSEPDLGLRDDARRLANIPGIDGIVSGHTHRRLPGHDHAGFALVDATKGTLGRRPAVMPGFGASDLAVLDLKLRWTKGSSWQVIDHHTTLRANKTSTPADPKIISLCQPTHRRIRKSLSEVCGHSELTIHNFFSLAKPTETCALVAAARRRVIAQAIGNTAEATLPILSSASAHTAGGRGGPMHFLHIPPGPIRLHHLAGLSPYANPICALRVTGRELRQWLEHSASVFSQLRPETANQPLLRPDRPPFDFSTIYGLHYTIDPMRDAGDRISHLTFAGRDIDPEEPFVLATNTFRAAGGGGGGRFAEAQVIVRSQTSLSNALVDILKDAESRIDLQEQPWRFSCPTPVQATIRTAPQSLKYLPQISHLDPHVDGIDDEGFARIRLTL